MNATLSTHKVIALWQKLTVFTLLFILVLLGAAYFFFIQNLVSEVQARKDLEKSLQASRGVVGELEFRYVSVSSRINLDVARSLGFREITDARVLALDPETLSFQR